MAATAPPLHNGSYLVDVAVAPDGAVFATGLAFDDTWSQALMWHLTASGFTLMPTPVGYFSGMGAIDASTSTVIALGGVNSPVDPTLGPFALRLNR